MITAKEAAKIAEESDAAINLRLDEIEKKIIELSKLNIRQLILQNVFPYHKEYIVEKTSLYHPAEFTAWQRILKKRIEQFGYRVTIEAYKYTVGASLGSMDEEPKTETGYQIVIGW